MECFIYCGWKLNLMMSKMAILSGICLEWLEKPLNTVLKRVFTIIRAVPDSWLSLKSPQSKKNSRIAGFSVFGADFIFRPNKIFPAYFITI